jgi:hypothetical protein
MSIAVPSAKTERDQRGIGDAPRKDQAREYEPVPEKINYESEIASEVGFRIDARGEVT